MTHQIVPSRDILTQDGLAFVQAAFERLVTGDTRNQTAEFRGKTYSFPTHSTRTLPAGAVSRGHEVGGGQAGVAAECAYTTVD